MCTATVSAWAVHSVMVPDFHFKWFTLHPVCPMHTFPQHKGRRGAVCMKGPESIAWLYAVKLVATLIFIAGVVRAR